MKKTPGKQINLTFGVLFLLVSSSFGQKELLDLKSSTDSSFGYKAENPLRMKDGNPQKSIEYTYKFLSRLRTEDGQSLTLLSRASMDNPNYKDPKIKLTDRSTGMPLSGKLNRLDRYTFQTSATRDTVILYVDIYHKGTLQLPIGLKYAQGMNE